MRRFQDVGGTDGFDTTKTQFNTYSYSFESALIVAADNRNMEPGIIVDISRLTDIKCG